MKLRLLVACALAVSLVLFAGAVGAQLKEGKSAEDKAAKARGAQDPNIKVTREKVEANNASKETPAPPHKGGAKSRGRITTARERASRAPRCGRLGGATRHLR